MSDGTTALSAPRRSIRITAIPPGEAPLWVREKWVGLELPLAEANPSPHEVYTSGVLSGPRNRFFAIVWRLFGRLERHSGYSVCVNDAVAVLARTAPEAASWWRENVPRLQHPGRKFLFRKSICELVDPAAPVNEAPVAVLPKDCAPPIQGPDNSPVPHIPLAITR